MDERVSYILGCISAAVGISSVPTSPMIASFLDAPDFATLQVIFDGELHYSLSIKSVPPKAREVHFLKLIPRALSPSELSSIVVGTQGSDPLSALFRSVRALSQPLIEEGKLDTRLGNLFNELESGISAMMKDPRRAQSLENVYLPSEEIEYWGSLANDSRADHNLQAQGQAFSEHFEKIAKQWADPTSLTASELQELLEDTLDSLDGLWKENAVSPYPQERMSNLLNVIAEALARTVQARITDAELWGGEFSKVRSMLIESSKICERWVEIMQELTQNYWRENRKWQGPAAKNQHLIDFIMRLEQVLTLRTQHDDLLRLLTPEEHKRLKVGSVFEPFKKIQVLYVSNYSVKSWEEALERYNSNMQPIEQEAAIKIRQDLQSVSNTAQQLRQFQKWQGIMSRENVANVLQPEREQLLSQLCVQVESLKEEFESRAGLRVEKLPGMDKPPQDPHMSPLISSIVWARQLQQKLSKILSSGGSLFLGLDNLGRLKGLCETTNKMLSDFQKQQFKTWRSDIENSLRDPQDPIALQLNGRMMELDLKDGLLKVGYSDKLVQLLKETRQLTEYSFSVPKNIKQVAAQGKKYYKEAIALKQVANFYNNMGSQIIECQKQMLLDSALAFEEVVKSARNLREGTVTWENPVEVEEYIQKVQGAANELMTENRRLRKAHFTILDQINELQNVNLLKNRQQWKEKLDEIRRNIQQTTLNKDENASIPWRAALDMELYKAMEVQYKLGLENLNENLPEIKADIVFSSRALSLRPPLEELKVKFYKEIRMFLSIPINFQGLGGNSDVYKKMPDKNSEGLLVIYTKAEALFKDLKELVQSYKPWTVLGKVNIEALVEEHCKEVQDWEINFKMLRQKRKEIEKLPENHKVHCFNISTGALKSALEDHLQRLSESLVVTLKSTIKNDVDMLEEFVKNAQTKLTTRPQSVEEIGQAQMEAVEVASQREGMNHKYTGLKDKSKLLMQLTGASINIAHVLDNWENFQVSLDSFGEIIEQQRELVKQEIEKKGDDVEIALEKFVSRWTALKPKPRDDFDYAAAVEASERVKEWSADWNAIKEKIESLKKECEHFNMPVRQFAIGEVEEELAEQAAAWSGFEEYKSQLDALMDEDWLSFRGRLYNFQDFFLSWGEKLKGKTRDAVGKFLSGQVELYKRAWPLLKLSTGEGFEKEHWKTLFHYLKLPKEVTMESLKFRHFIDNVAYLIASADQIKELQARAQGEVTIREAIQELRVWCDEAVFSLVEHSQNDRVTPLIKDWKELMTQVSDNQSLLSSLKESRFFDRFADQIEQFELKLSSLDEYLAKLSVIQRKWVYLEPIFGRGALPQEQGRFKRIDSEYRSIMLGVGADPRVISLCNIQGLKDTLEMLLDQLERCQKALNDFLEEKRSKFPRFYFIGDDDLLEILGQSRNPSVIQSHLKKLFGGIHKVKFEENTIVAFLSSAGETVPLHSPVQVNDEVEIWLDHLSKEMQKTLAANLQRAMQVQDLSSLTGQFPSQICCLKEVIDFCTRCPQAISNRSLDSLKRDLQGQLSELTGTRSNDSLLILKIKSLILDLIHNIEVVDLLIDKQCASPADWDWHRQLKFGLDDRRSCYIEMCEAKFDYTYEYQGNAQKLVHTPLTDKCYLTLTQGMMMGYGGNPYGPAGTGKTESVKALAQAFGRQCLVFNCDEGIDFKSMGRIFIGLVKCGAWGCFDEFNRLLEEQLSAISQQIQVIQWAIKNKEKTLDLLGRTIEVNHNAGIFVTMNPAGKGYGGRSKLPDNLKMLFRPVAMSVPDNELIAEVMMFSEGFKNAKVLAKKLVELFVLSKQLLSSQEHYDWGLRALKTTLTVGGQLIQNERQISRDISSEREAVLLIKAIRINTLPKLTYSDLKRFIPLVSDIFTGTSVEDIQYEELEEAIKQSLLELKLEYSVNQVNKILQFHENTRQRMGVVLVGPSGCGKSTIWKVLKLAYEKLNQQLISHVMNPKSMKRQHLLGHMDPDTREWSEGVLTAAARECVKQPLEVRSWVVCDGDIDPEWIESLNSVLDDNHLLTLPTGERISFADNVNFIFETNDLRFASPATVSRMGMIFMSEEDVDIKRLITSWLKKQPEDDQGRLEKWVEEILVPAIEWALYYADEMAEKTTKVGTVMSALSVLAGVKTKGEFVYGVIRGLASNFTSDLKNRFATELFNRSREAPADSRAPLDCYWADTAFRSFTSENENFELNLFKDYRDPPLVRTVGIQRDIMAITAWLELGQPFIVVGPEGCGKSLMLRQAFKHLRSTQVAILYCNAQTTASHVIQKLLNVCSQSTGTQGRVLRPRDSSRLILYLKDVNLPTPDKYNTIQLIAFLQQLVTYQGFYDNLDFVNLERVQIVASMNPSSTVGRHILSPRFTANVRIIRVDYPTRDELISVYTQYLKNILKIPTLGNSASNASRLAQATIDVYSSVCSKFSVDEHRHYLFTPRDITQWIFGLLRYEAKTQPELLEAWGYECTRIFKDRLVSKEHFMQFDGILNATLRSSLGHNERLECMFTTWTATHEAVLPTLPPMGRVEGGDLKSIMSQGLLAYEREFRELKMHIFDESLSSVAKVNRSLSMPGGCLLLVGESGVGRRNATLLVSHMLNFEFFTPNITRDYGEKEFRRDLKTVLQSSGIEGRNLVLFLEDYQIVRPSFLELLNSLLGGGDVPGLYTSEEIEPLLAPLADEMRQEGGFRTLYDFFVSRVKKFLRIVLSLDSSHPLYEQYCASNPALYTSCNIEWFQPWSKESMAIVSETELQEQLAGLKAKQELVDLSITLHRSSPRPVQRGFMDLLKNFLLIYSNRINSQGGQSTHLKAGLGKLKEAEKLVGELKQKAEHQRKLLAEKQREADDALKKITKAMQEAAERRQEVEVLQGNLQKENVTINKQKSEIETQLEGIKPLVEEAQRAVGGIRKESLDELKALRMPPEAVHDVLSAVLRIMGNSNNHWNEMKEFLKGRSVISSIVNFDPRRITPEIRDDVWNLVRKKKNSFEESTIYRASIAAAPMASWVKALLEYSVVLEKIRPLESNLGKAISKLETSQKRVMECEEQLERLDQDVQNLKDSFAQRTSEAEQLKTQLKQEEETLMSAQELLEKLSGEKGRWEQQLADLQESLELLPKHSMIAAGFVSFLSAHSEDVREGLMKSWKLSAGVSSYDFTRFMTSESEMLRWKGEGLPGDSLSMENAVAIFSTCKTPLIVDPATSATSWLKRQEAKQLEIVNQSDPRFSNQLELAVRFGKTMIVQEIDKVEPMLFPLLRKDLIKQGPRWTVLIGEKLIDYTESFKLFLCTRDSSIEVTPNALACVSLINFTVTRSGLEGQLLSIILNHEQPELEQQKTEMLAKEEKLKVELSDLEKQLLEALATAEGNLLENRGLIDSLNQTKANSSYIAEALQRSHDLQTSLDEQREVYRSLARDGSVIFSMLQDLKKVDNMYQFSLASFLKLFTNALQVQVNARDLQAKLQELGRTLIRMIFMYVSRSLFKRDRLMFGLHFIHSTRRDMFETNEWEFLKGEVAATGDAGRLFPSWAPDDRRDEFGMLAATFPRFVNYLQLDNDSLWTPWGESPNCETEFPSSLQARLSPVQRLLLVKVLRPDRLESGMQCFVADSLQDKDINPPPLSLKLLYDETSNTEPVLFTVSPGADPTKELEDFAEEKIGRHKFVQMAMGGGQNEEALQLLRAAATKGEWLYLKNLHLVISWLPALEKELKTLSPHSDFRLWLTTEPHPRFPAILLQSSLKVSYESPPGIKQNLQRTYESWGPSFVTNGPPVRSHALFSLAVLHAILQERRVYIPQGWSKFYEFSLSDLRAGTSLLEQVLQTGRADWITLKGLLEKAVYGGRIDNDFDTKVLCTYLDFFFSDETFRSGNLTKEIRLPSNNGFSDYMNVIAGLPELESPAMFGLPMNIDRSVQRFNSANVVKQLKMLSAISQDELKFDREEWSAKLGPLWNLWQTLIRSTDKFKGNLEESDEPVESFVFMEARHAYKMLETVHMSLEGISKVISGTGLLTSSIEHDGKALLQSLVPDSWTDMWDGPSSPIPWLRALVRRTTALKKWVEMVKSGTLFNDTISLGDLFHPETFLNALRQLSARRAGAPMEQLKLISSFEGKINGGIQLKGLFLQGCEFNKGGLVSPRPNSPELTSLPNVYVAWVTLDTKDPYPKDKSVSIPIYHSLDREKFLCSLVLPNHGASRERVISGAALLLTGE